MIKIDFLETNESFSEEEVSKIVSETFAAFGVKDGTIEIWFTTDQEIKRLNKQYRNIDKATDVLSFPQIKIGKKIEHLGTLAISQNTVKAKNEKLPDVIKHGLLHLLGFDHEEDELKWNDAANKINCEL